MLSRLKQAGSATWRGVKAVGRGMKTIVLPSIITVCRLVSGAGQLIFTLPQFFKYITGSEKNFLSLPITLYTMAMNLTTNFTSRTVFIFNNFNPAMFKRAQRSNAVGQPVEEDIEIHSNTGQAFLVSMTACSLYAGAAGSVSNYFFCIKFIEFILENLTPHAIRPDTATAMPLVQGVAIAFFAASFFNHVSFQLSTTRNNVKKFVHHLETSDEHSPPANKKAIALTSLVGSFGTVTVPLFAYLSTNAALARIPFVNQYSKWLAGISAGTATAQHVTTALFSTYRFFSEKSEETRRMGCGEATITYAVRWALVSDFACTGISNFIGATDTLPRVFSLDPKSYPLMIGSVVCSSTAALMNTLLTHEGFKGSKKLFIQGLSDDELPVAMADEEAQPLLADETIAVKPLVTVSVAQHHRTLFGRPTSALDVHVHVDNLPPGSDVDVLFKMMSPEFSG